MKSGGEKVGGRKGRRALVSADNAKDGHLLKQIYMAFGIVKMFFIIWPVHQWSGSLRKKLFLNSIISRLCEENLLLKINRWNF